MQAYASQIDPQTGLWQIVSRSGHVLYESEHGAYVRQVCSELNSLCSSREKAFSGSYRSEPLGCGA